jgi:plastocyanin
MKLLALFAVYGLIAALLVPGSLLAQEEAEPPETATPAEPAPAAPAPAQPAPAEAAPAPSPEPQFLADERADSPDPPPKAIAAASGSVTIADFSFTPATITINQGDTVTWINDGPTPHSATANNGSFDTGILKKGGSGSHTFNEAGSFSYYCKPHPFMKGTVVVQASQTGGGKTGGSGSGEAGATGGTTGGSGAEAAQSDGGPTLPNSGSDSGALLVLGALMLVLGVAVHRHTAAREARPTGRIGW